MPSHPLTVSQEPMPEPPSRKEVDVQVNGEVVACQAGTNVPSLLALLGYPPQLVAVEYNGEILHRQFWEQTQLASGDRLEIVTVVGGG